MITMIGTHTVKNSNILDGIDDLMQGQQADLFMSDPPWGQGNLRYWETIRLKQDGLTERRENNQPDFLNTFFNTAFKYTKNVAIVAYGKKWQEEIKSHGLNVGFSHHFKIETQYKSGSKMLPMDAHVFSKQELYVPPEYLALCAGTFGYDSVYKVGRKWTSEGGILLDPCCGMGYMAQLAIDTGMNFRGNEMNKNRLSKTISRLKKSVLMDENHV